jgi:hypothetical protein
MALAIEHCINEGTLQKDEKQMIFTAIEWAIRKETGETIDGIKL